MSQYLGLSWNLQTCAASKDSDQPVHFCSLIRIFWIAQEVKFLDADKEDSDQTVQMYRLILSLLWVHVKHVVTTSLQRQVVTTMF